MIESANIRPFESRIIPFRTIPPKAFLHAVERVVNGMSWVKEIVVEPASVFEILELRSRRTQHFVKNVEDGQRTVDFGRSLFVFEQRSEQIR